MNKDYDALDPHPLAQRILMIFCLFVNHSLKSIIGIAVGAGAYILARFAVSLTPSSLPLSITLTFGSL